MTWGAVATVGASVVSGALSKSSSDSASNTVGKANALTQQQIDAQKAENNKAFSPYSNLGLGANSKLGYLMGVGSKTDKYTLDDFLKYNHDYAPSWYQASGPQGTDANTQYDQYLSDPSHYTGANDPTKYGFRQLNDNSDGSYGSLLSKFSQNDLNNDAVYNNGLQFGLDEGTKAVNRLAAARGGIDSGATLKALTRYANDYGSTKAEGAYNRFNADKNQTYNFLSGQQGVGLNATTSNQAMNNGLVTAGANANQNAANQQAGFGIQGAAGLNNSIQGGIGNYLYNQRSQAYNGSVVGNPSYNSLPRYTSA
jgi:hypothetical protein